MDITDEIKGILRGHHPDAVEEHLWKQYPEYTTFRDPVTGKWFALFMLVRKSCFGLPGDDSLPVVNVKADKDFIALMSGRDGIYPAYHMSKKSWISLFLDGSMEKERIIDLIETSYRLITDTPTKRIYEAVKKIPEGKVATYAQIAAMAGNPRMSRAVGNALHKNSDPDHVPCYRVVNSRGELSGAFAFGGPDEQAKRLRADGIEVKDGKVDLEIYQYKI
ncbi:MAG: methylated-DNA--[protein]-cysteine S-methyltransferase [Lachnospiraceae bacterium]|jgi:O-6-methylguanine DNA methyltransferase|nr:methylated-DNA--[protein]-cysteine S-methyltransferase [Lachnospiraceae bacterium]MEE3460352.1 methylated-DNA--[protein]-cysteine S-methyltransferase [Lachnospiraceae bacterium]